MFGHLLRKKNKQTKHFGRPFFWKSLTIFGIENLQKKNKYL